MGKAFEGALGFVTSAAASLVLIIIGTYVAGMEYSRVFSLLEIMASLKMNILMFSRGMGYYYEMKVVFGRFANIFNIANKQMIKVDPN